MTELAEDDPPDSVVLAVVKKPGIEVFARSSEVEAVVGDLDLTRAGDVVTGMLRMAMAYPEVLHGRGPSEVLARYREFSKLLSRKVELPFTVMGMGKQNRY